MKLEFQNKRWNNFDRNLIKKSLKNKKQIQKFQIKNK